MKTLKLKNNLEFSRVIAGCMRTLDAGMDGGRLRDFVHACLDLGITTFDHAPVYGASGCEKIFGDEVLRKEPDLRKKMQIVTKAGIILPGQKGNQHIYYDSTKENLLAEIDASLMRLGTDHVDLLLIHRPDVLGDPRVIGETLDEIVASGKALAAGVSNYEPIQVDALQHFMKTPLVANQMEFSIKSTDNFFNGVVDNALMNGMGLMAWSPLGGGSVFKGEDEQSVRLRKVLSEIADAHGAGMDTVMYAWVLCHPAEIMAITGTMNTDRIRAAARALDLALSYDEWYGILAASRGFDVP